jgi:DNA (cytosine-5)-methyltransferase 1
MTGHIGYACDVFAIDAAHFVPQGRLRILVIGIQTADSNQDLFVFSKRSSALKTRTLEKAVIANLDLSWHFFQIPPLPEKISADLGQVVENLPDSDSRWWSDDEVKRHLDMMSVVNLTYLEELQQLSAYGYSTMYRRVREGQQRAELRKDGLAGCLRTARGGSSRQITNLC